MVPSSGLRFEARRELRAFTQEGHVHSKLVPRSAPITQCSFDHKRSAAIILEKVPDKGSIFLAGKDFSVGVETEARWPSEKFWCAWSQAHREPVALKRT